VWGTGPNDKYRATGINVSTGDTIRGTMEWEKNYSGYWNVQFYDSDTGQSSSFDTTTINTDQDLAVFTALEGFNIEDDGDVPGDTTFDNMVFQHDSNTVDITWSANVTQGTGLTGLSVTIYSDNKVKLNT
jgi:hypothetical protein